MLDASSEYWNMSKNKKTIKYDLQINLIIKNNFVFTVRVITLIIK